MADQILDRDKHPTWQGQRTKLVYAFPANEKLWERYAQIRADSFRSDGDGHEATEFYREHRDQMDAGSVVAWPQRHNEDELSAIQHAMNLKLQDERAFWAEYQNEPLPEDEGDVDQLTAEQVAAKVNGHAPGEVPLAASHLTMFIDVQGKLLFHTVVAWEDDFTGYVLEYGAYPEQRRALFTLRDVQKTLGQAAPGAGLEGSVYAGLEDLTGDYLSRRWRRDDGAELQIERCLIDARVVDEWKLRAGHPDNHWLDCLVGCAVAASIHGAVLPGTDAKTSAPRRRIKLSEIQRTHRG